MRLASRANTPPPLEICFASYYDVSDVVPPEVQDPERGVFFMNGSRIRQDPRRRSVILVALTGWGQEEDRRRTRAAGFDHHLVKPADLDALRVLFDSVGRRDARPRPGVETGT
mgnify:CR=1 FL=1